MQQLLFTIRDTKGEIYNKPFPQLTKNEALRTFADLAKDPQTNIAQHPEDYDLYYLGTYDTTTGKIEALESPAHIVKAINAIPKNNTEKVN